MVAGFRRFVAGMQQHRDRLSAGAVEKVSNRCPQLFSRASAANTPATALSRNGWGGTIGTMVLQCCERSETPRSVSAGAVEKVSNRCPQLFSRASAANTPATALSRNGWGGTIGTMVLQCCERSETPRSVSAGAVEKVSNRCPQLFSRASAANTPATALSRNGWGGTIGTMVLQCCERSETPPERLSRSG
ncbi:hypothetical protein Mal15_22860 [Stieleria maiorica]|uniref:Uncharacterized protein n=1 Tax=Stieleria maiorica TaxID=2795974 RepID=A0A5B9MGP8_9BACT|nr:hypothetical protein Mal15_22860 [Stieleria maiorica]